MREFTVIRGWIIVQSVITFLITFAIFGAVGYGLFQLVKAGPEGLGAEAGRAVVAFEKARQGR